MARCLLLRRSPKLSPNESHISKTVSQELCPSDNPRRRRNARLYSATGASGLGLHVCFRFMPRKKQVFFFFSSRFTGPARSLSRKMSDRRVHHMISVDEGTATQLRRNFLAGFNGLCVTIFLEIPYMYPRHCLQICFSVPSTNVRHKLTRTKLLASHLPGKTGPYT